MTKIMNTPTMTVGQVESATAKFHAAMLKNRHRITRGAARELLGRKNSGRIFADTFIKCAKEISESILIMRDLDPTELIEGRDSWEIISTDTLSGQLAKLSPNSIRLVTMLERGEPSITGEVALRRLEEEGYIPLDAHILLTLLNEPGSIPESWDKKTDEGQDKYILFDGTRFRPRDSAIPNENNLYTMCLHRNGNGPWRPSVCKLSLLRRRYVLSAVLVPSATE